MEGFSPSVNLEELQEEAEIDEQGRWLNSKVNVLEEVVDDIDPPDEIKVKDDTLREGENTPNVNISDAQKIDLAHELDEAGVAEIEVGYVGSIQEHYDLCTKLNDEGLDMRFNSHTRLWADDYEEEIDRAYEAGADVINIIGDPSYILHPLWPTLSRDGFFEKLSDVVAYAKDQGLFVAYGLGTWTPSFEKCFEVATDAGLDRAYIYDGKGWYTPEAIGYLTRQVKRVVGPDVQLAVHCHDDYGLAVANTIKAVTEGAEVVDVLVNKLGHRAGNASFEQVVLALEALYGVETGIDVGQLFELCKLFEQEFGVPIHPNRPHVGDNAYTHSGLHTVPILEGAWHSFENINADTLGAPRKLQLGTSGLHRDSGSPVAVKIEKMGYDYSDSELATIVDRVSQTIESNDRPLNEDELEEVILEVMS